MIRQGFIAATAAWLAIAATAAQAQTTVKANTAPCLTPDEAEAAMLMMAPGALRGAIKVCTPKLAANAYLRVSGTALVARYEAAAAAAEPLAGRVMSKMMGGSGEGAPKGAAAMLSPMGEMMVTAMGEKLTAPQCGMIDQGLSLLDPLPPHNLTALIVMAAQAGAEKDAGKSPFTICRPIGLSAAVVPTPPAPPVNAGPQPKR